MRTLYIISAFLILIQFICSGQVLFVPDFSEQIDYESGEMKYSVSDITPDNAINCKFFNQSEQLTEQMYEFGYGISKNNDEAKKWY